jgi:prepilin-type N-terminal cleavage/methylation domain-containing protein
MLRRAFTLIELLVSLSVLLVVIIATARIFGTTSKVAAIGEASADLQATANAVEKVIRGDVERIARDGVLAIQCVAVRNDVNRSTTYPQAPLLDTTKAVTDFVRCDQLVFFGRGRESSQVYLGTRGGSRSDAAYSVNMFPSGTLKITPEFTAQEFMVRIGHGVQFPTLLLDSNNPTLRPDADFFDTVAKGNPPVPWMWSPTPVMSSSYFDGAANTLKYMAGQPEARQWTLARQIVLLADDGINTNIKPTGLNLTWFHEVQQTGSGASWSGGMTANSATGIAQYGPSAGGSATPDSSATNFVIPQDNLYPNRALTSSRVDIAATSIADFRALIEQGATSAYFSKDFNFDSTGRLPWSDREAVTPNTSLGYIRNRIYNALFGAPIVPTGRTSNGLWGYPRAEKVAPSMNRLDGMVAGPLLAGNCSSIQIDWTWSTGTARFETPEGTPLLAQLSAAPVRANKAVFDVPLAGLTTVPWPVQPFLQLNPTGSLVLLDPANSPVSITKNDNSSEASQTLGLSRNIPWFGLPDSLFPIAQRSGVTRLAGPLITDVPSSIAGPAYATPIRALTPSAASTTTTFTAASATTDFETIAIATPPIDCARIEGTSAIVRPLSTLTEVYSYQAIFGPNGDQPFREVRVPGGTERVLRNDYTPWPTALRFTITLHDPKLALAQGRVFQFVVDLPKADR